MADQVAQDQPVYIATAEIVGNVFARQYYTILQQSPDHVHRFYHDISKLGRLENGDCVMSSTTTMKAIDEKIQSFGSLKAEIKFVDAQESYNGGVIVLVTGSMINEDDSRRGFTQTFFLAPQDKGYFVLNDMFRYLEDDFHPSPKQDDGIDPIKASQEISPQQENHISNQSNGVGYNPPDDSEIPVEEVGEEEEEPVAEVVNEAPNESQVVIESDVKAEEVPKKSYASIVMKDPPHISSSSSLPKSASKIQEQQSFVNPAPLLVAPTSKVIHDGNNQEREAGDVHSIYVKNLPVNVTYALVEEEFKRFGPIKSDGIQIINNKGFYFGFVEFEVSSAVRSAIEASPIVVGGREVVIEEKKSTNSRVNGNRGRYQGRGSGSKAEGVRGRGSFGAGRGRSYGRGDSNNKNEFGNYQGSERGYQNHVSEGYQRSDRMGYGTGRANRGGGSSLSTTRAQRVSAQA